MMQAAQCAVGKDSITRAPAISAAIAAILAALGAATQAGQADAVACSSANPTGAEIVMA